MALFTADITIDCPPQQAFDFLTRPTNILEVSPPETGLSYRETPEVYHLDAIIKFAIVSFGQPREVVHKVTEFKSPEYFVEEMIDGPVPFWKYTHRFEPEGSGVRVVDEIEFEPPGGLLGMIVTESRILDNLEDGFDHRYARLEKLLSQS